MTAPSISEKSPIVTMRDRLAMNYSLEAISQARAAGRECHLIMSDVAKKAYEYADAMLAERGAK